MRIIAGKYKSRAIVAPPGTATRPTTDRARESLFNVLSNVFDFEGARVLDLFAGSGALAVEAMSRGAANATLIERDRKALAAIKTNIASLALQTQVHSFPLDVFSYLKSTGEQFDLIFADAPYQEKRSLTELPKLVFINNWLNPDGICVIEHSSDDSVTPCGNSQIVRELKVGEAAFTLLQRKLVDTIKEGERRPE